jgi:XRE family transcriptional regulator, fatty acid utilization regulator
MSFSDLSEKTGMSVSYLNEIEKGKKFPKPDKVQILAAALGISEQELRSTTLPKSLEPVETLLNSNFLNDLPLDLFGIELAKVVEIIANAPLRVGAFISTLVELSRNYALREENFYFAALRSYLELHNNYFEDLEEEALKFGKLHKVPLGHAVSPKFLGNLLEKKFGYSILEQALSEYPELGSIRAVYLPKTRKLLLKSGLNHTQKAFQFGKELGFNVLDLKERAYTSSLLRVKTFDEALNHFKAGYFSAALLMNREHFLLDIKQFLQMSTWDSGDFLKKLMLKYQATPEMLFQRMTNILPQFLGLDKIFILRFIHNLETNKFDINKELHLNRRHHPHANGLDEHYCRRWVSISLLQEFGLPNADIQTQDCSIGIQKSRYHQTNDEYLCLTIVRKGDGNRNISITIGVLIEDNTHSKIKFLDDPHIPQREVSTTCERCAVLNCAERAHSPAIITQKKRRAAADEALKKLSQFDEPAKK